MMKISCFCVCAGIAAFFLASVMFHRERRGLKRRADGELRKSREQMLRDLQPSWWIDARTRKSLRNLLALDDTSSCWIDEVRMDAAANCGRHFLCTRCGSTGAHVLNDGMGCNSYYRCLDCGGRGVAVHGGVSPLFASSSAGEDVGGGGKGSCYNVQGSESEHLPTGGGAGGDDEDSCCDEQESESEYLPDGSGDSDEEESQDGMSWFEDGTEAQNLDGGSDVGSCTDNDSLGEDDPDIPVSVKFYPDTCDNCHRRSVGTRNRYESTDGRSVRLRSVWVMSGSFRRRFATMNYATARAAAAAVNSGLCRKNRVRLKLCPQCKHALTDEHSKIREEDVWPALMWEWLTDQRLMRRFGSDLWKVVPDEWRRWWVDAIRECVPLFCGVTLDSPLPIFSDVTDRKGELERGLATMRASTMQHVCNKHLLPLVRCPWGCSEYFHKCGLLSFDLIVRKLFGPSVKPVFGGEKYIRGGDPKTEGMAPDYGDVCQIPCLLGNEAWKIRPSVAFVDGIPRVLGCRHHGDGSNGKCFYPPRNPHGVLPCCMGDQIAPAVVRPRNVKQFKPHAFSDTYQMSEMQGQFSGVDTFHLTTAHDFSSESILLQKNEALAMTGRKDVASLVSEWGDSKNNVLPPYVAEDMMRNAEDSAPSEEVVEDCCRAATYITLSDAVKLYQVNKERQGRVVRTHVEGEVVDSHYTPPWPSATIHVHPYNCWGSEFPLLPAMQHSESDCHLLWSLSGMLLGIPSLWESTDRIVSSSDEWHGWLLTYLTSVCFPTSRRGGHSGNPFKFHHRSVFGCSIGRAAGENGDENCSRC